MAVKFGKAWGCHTTVISRGVNKKESALALGADGFLDSTDAGDTANIQLIKYKDITNAVLMQNQHTTLEYSFSLHILQKLSKQLQIPSISFSTQSQLITI